MSGIGWDTTRPAEKCRKLKSCKSTFFMLNKQICDIFVPNDVVLALHPQQVTKG